MTDGVTGEREGKLDGGALGATVGGVLGLRMRIYSHSSLGSFETCPRQFWYRYIGKPEIEKVETIEAFLGSRVHETCRVRSGG